VKICFATNNQKKLEEIRQILGDEFEVLSLDDIGCTEELPETQKTIEGNSLQKAEYVLKKYGIPCFADDTGLEVHYLDGAPGVFSARYAGEQRDDNANINLLLKNMDGVKDRKAQFKTIITWVTPKKIKQFEGIVKGKILTHRQGTGGFGYDPIFQPTGQDVSFAQMTGAQKNLISHRGKAMEKLVKYLRKQSARKQ
jgi:XTP/dITP diphosphohydrolase